MTQDYRLVTHYTKLEKLSPSLKTQQDKQLSKTRPIKLSFGQYKFGVNQI